MSSIDEFLPDCVSGGLAFANAVEAGLRALAPDLLAGADVEQALREPLVLAAFASGDPLGNMGAAIGGFIRKRPTSFRSRTSRRGGLMAPGVGELSTDRASTAVEVRLASDDLATLCWPDGSSDRHAVRPMKRLANTHIRLPAQPHFLIEDRLGMAASDYDALDHHAPTWAEAMRTAASALSQAYPLYWAAILECAREVILFHSNSRNSFATTDSHGSCFINIAGAEPSVAMMIEEMAHQCGHIVFSSIAHDPASMLAPAPETPLAHLLRGGEEHRTVWSALHGLVTECLIAKSLDLCLVSNALCHADALECLARLSFIMRKLSNDLRQMNAAPLFTPRGQQLYRVILNDYLAIGVRLDAQTRSHCFQSQTYNFDYAAFNVDNPAFRAERPTAHQ